MTFAALLYVLWNFRFFSSSSLNSSSPSLRILNEMKEKGAYDFSLMDLENQKVSLGDFKNKIVLIHFWASWCEACIIEWAPLLDLVKGFREDLVLLAVSIDTQREDVESFLKAYQKISSEDFVKILLDSESKVASLYGVDSIPESYIVAPERKLLKKIMGSQNWNSKEFFSFFEFLIQQHLSPVKSFLIDS